MKEKSSMAQRFRLITGLFAVCLTLMVIHQPAKAVVDISVCGNVTSYVAPSVLNTGVITIGGVPYVILAGVNLQGTGLITPNANLCLNASTNLAGLITSGTLTLNNVTTTISVCGKVTAISANSITINGVTYPIAAGAAIDGANQVTSGADACLNATLNASGQIVAPSSITVQATTTVNICGVVSALSANSITINGTTIPIAAGTNIAGINQVNVGTNACLSATLNASGQIVAPSSITVQATTTVNVCGVVSAISPTSITINGVVYPIASGANIDGANLVTVGANACLSATLNASGQIVAPSYITVQATTTVNVCGVVSAVSPTSITINGVTYPIASGVNISGINQINVGTNACLSATLNASGQIVAPSTITVQAGTTINICGIVSAISPTSITINGTTIPIATGVTINGINNVNVGANACLAATLNASGQIVAPSSVTVQATSNVNVCGVVSAISATSITINGVTYPIATGANIAGINNINVGTNACLSATLNASGQIVTPSSITVQGSTSINVCGVVSAVSPTSITINGVTYPIATGAVINGINNVNVGANACLNATLNAAGQITAPSTITAKFDTTVSVCGVVSAISATSITINGVVYPIASGANIAGINQVNVGANVCLNATVNASGQITAPSSITVSATSSISLCGRVDAYQAATATAPGFISIGGANIVIAAGTRLSGAENIVVGANLCLNATVNASGQIIPPATVAVNVNTTISVCGKVTAFVAATANTPGSITVGGVTLTILPGVVLSGVTIGAEICLTGSGGNPGGGGGGGLPGGQVGPGTVVTSVDGSCNQLRFTVPLATQGFLKTAALPDGDLFMLHQGLNFSVVSTPTTGVEVFEVNPSTFGGTPAQIGNFTGDASNIMLQGLAVTATGRTIRAVSCTDSVQKIDFVLAGAGNVGSTVRFFVQNANGSNMQQLGFFVAEAGGWRVVTLNSQVSLFLNNRLLTGAGMLTFNSLIPYANPAGSAGNRTALLTFAFTKLADSTLMGCNQLGIDVTNVGGKTSVVVTDVVVNRLELPGDRLRTELGLLAGGAGGYPTGIPCATVCPPCNAPSQSNTTLVSGSSFDHNSVSSEGIVSIFGTELATATASATTKPLPTVLAGVSVTITDNLGVTRQAPLFYISPTQINFLIPDGTAMGNAGVTITNGGTAVAGGTVKINAVAPGLFSADSNGQGTAAGVFVRVKADGSQVIEPLARFDASQGKMVATEIDLSSSDRVYLVLFGTGIRYRSDATIVQAQVGTLDLPVEYAGVQGEFLGLDQVNLLLPTSLSGSGQTKVTLKVDGRLSNQVGIMIK